ncbi:MAG: DNA recombination protein RmuC [Flavobacterium sp. BFFFF2]|nr:MAG: DNA recombination protein RmuC [Flavobacterium sp. BFFFF2]
MAGYIILAAVVACGIGFWLGKKTKSIDGSEQLRLWEEKWAGLQQQLTQAENRINQEQQRFDKQTQLFKDERNLLLNDKEQLTIGLTRKQAECEHVTQKLNEQQEEIRNLREAFTKEFENLANKILEEKSQKFTAQNQEQLKMVLGPLQEKIQLFEKKVEDTHKESIDYHASLRQQIIGLRDLNEQMSKEAVNLTKALKGDNKIQGNWGELILERVLEKSGLERGREYEVQQSVTLADGSRQQPDVVIALPDGKKMIVDSKVTLTAYERFVNAEDDAHREQALKEHVLSLKRHIEQLSAKNYPELYAMQSPDFVLLFIPIEPAFAFALREDPQLYNRAFEKNIVVVTPTTLLATLRTIDSMWANQKQQENALEIARQAGALYDKFEGLITDLLKLGKKMDDAKGDYVNAMSKLSEGKGNLIISVEKLKRMGAKAKKSLPENILNRAQSAEELPQMTAENTQNEPE